MRWPDSKCPSGERSPGKIWAPNQVSEDGHSGEALQKEGSEPKSQTRATQIPSSACSLEHEFSTFTLPCDNEEMHQMSLRGKLFVGGTNCHTRNFKETKPTDWCVNCQHYGHTAPICHKTSRCLYCADDHPTVQHNCNACRANKGCEHVRCANCNGNHEANDKKCNEWQQVLSRQHRRQIRPNQQDTP
jgi:hypothetical protein